MLERTTMQTTLYTPSALCFKPIARTSLRQRCCGLAGRIYRQQAVAPGITASAVPPSRQQQHELQQHAASRLDQQQQGQQIVQLQAGSADRVLAALALWALTDVLPAQAAAEGLPGGPPASSYYVSLGLFVMTLPGLWSLIKRAPKAKIKRRTYEVPGPAQAGAMPLDQRAQQIFRYFKNYNYEVKSTGDVITFEGQYRASKSQAAALVAYTLISLASTALVLSIAAPWGGNYWYLLCLISPAAGVYYLKNADRTEQMKVKMVTADDDLVTDIVMEGDEEELDRFANELGMLEKGKIKVKGILER